MDLDDGPEAKPNKLVPVVAYYSYGEEPARPSLPFF